MDVLFEESFRKGNSDDIPIFCSTWSPHGIWQLTKAVATLDVKEVKEDVVTLVERQSQIDALVPGIISP